MFCYRNENTGEFVVEASSPLTDGFVGAYREAMARFGLEAIFVPAVFGLPRDALPHKDNAPASNDAETTEARRLLLTREEEPEIVDAVAAHLPPSYGEATADDIVVVVVPGELLANDVTEVDIVAMAALDAAAWATDNAPLPDEFFADMTRGAARDTLRAMLAAHLIGVKSGLAPNSRERCLSAVLLHFARAIAGEPTPVPFSLLVQKVLDFSRRADGHSLVDIDEAAMRAVSVLAASPAAADRDKEERLLAP